MIIGKKFWGINAPGSYNPGDYAGSLFGGVINATVTVTGVPAAAITAIDALLALPAPVGINGNYIVPGTTIVSTDSISEITLSNPALSSGRVTNLRFWDMTYPSAAGGDGAIQAVICLDSSHGTFEFVDSNGKTVTIPASTCVKGAVYYWQILEVTTVTAGDFIGMSAN